MPSLITADRIHARRLAAVNRLLPAIMVANVMCACGLTALEYRAHGAVLMPWLALLTSLSVARFVEAIRFNRHPPRQVGGREARWAAVKLIGIGLLSTGVQAWLLPQTSGLSFTIVVCQLTGTLWAGSTLVFGMMSLAYGFVIVSVAIIDLGFLVAGLGAEHVYLAILFIGGAATALRTAQQQAELFTSNEQRKLELERQGDLIELLLKDYEEQTSDWLWETDADLRLRTTSERFGEALDRPTAAIDGTRLDALLVDHQVEGNDEAHAELQAHLAARRPFRDLIIPLTVGDEQRWWALSGRPYFFGDTEVFAGYRGVSADITSNRLAQARIAHLAHHDALTNLQNRSAFRDRLERCLHHLDHAKLAVISLDLDGFKAVNDRYGHPVGDALLVAVAERLRDGVEAEDEVARFGGDEFVILDARLAETVEVDLLCQKLLSRLSEPFDIGAETVSIGVSIGVAFAPADGVSAQQLLKNADAALYRAKAEGRGAFRFFSPEMDRQLQERQALLQDLRAALGRGEFVLFFQPFVCAADGSVSGCEALIRWFHPVRGMVSPAEFIPLAEESGLIVAIGAWVVEQACREAARWPAGQRVAVNVSPVQLRDRSLPGTILAALTKAGLSPARLEVEITEAVLIDDAEAAMAILRQIRAMGVRIALDDFGTGYSSLSYLRRFPFDKVKIDRSFVHDLDQRHDSQIIVQAIGDLARGLGMTITAEGVETAEEAARLRQTGCEELQGFLFARPKIAAELEHLREGGCGQVTAAGADPAGVGELAGAA